MDVETLSDEDLIEEIRDLRAQLIFDPSKKEQLEEAEREAEKRLANSQ